MKGNNYNTQKDYEGKWRNMHLANKLHKMFFIQINHKRQNLLFR